MSPRPKRGILDIEPYVPGRARAEGFEHPLKLSANENPFGCSEAARDAYLAASHELHVYPDASTARLRAAIAEKFALEPERLVFGAGSDEVFVMACQAFLNQGDNIVQPQFGFAAWAIAAHAAGGRVNSAPERDYTASVDALLAAVDENTRIVFLANPANPTGTWLAFDEVRRLHLSLPEDVLLVMDEAYAECAAGANGFADCLAWSRDKPNVLVTRTFSKAYGLAALRIGWGYGAADVIAAMARIRLPFSVSRPGEAAAIAALADQSFVDRSVAQFAAGRARLAIALEQLGLRTLPSACNFVTVSFTDAPVSAGAVCDALAKTGILVRHLSNYGMPEWLRITIGTEGDVDRTVGALKSICGRS
jgi:histidinol-phosphate aminotransferase